MRIPAIGDLGPGFISDVDPRTVPSAPIAVNDLWCSTALPAPPTPPPPQPTLTRFGFNIAQGTGYTQGASETAAQSTARIVSTFGGTHSGKIFYGGDLPSTFQPTLEGVHPTKGPVVVCFNVAPGSIAARTSHYAGYAASVPPGWDIRLCYGNEFDNGKGDMIVHRQDQDALYDAVHGVNPAARVEVWDVFMEYSVDPLGANIFDTDWVTPAKRDGICWDVYWNQSTTSKDPNTRLGNILTAMTALGMTRWGVGETGDRRDESGYTDSARASRWTERLTKIAACEPTPEFCCYFDVIGTTGDHRILPQDTATTAVLAGFIS